MAGADSMANNAIIEVPRILSAFILLPLHLPGERITATLPLRLVHHTTTERQTKVKPGRTKRVEFLRLSGQRVAARVKLQCFFSPRFAALFLALFLGPLRTGAIPLDAPICLQTHTQFARHGTVRQRNPAGKSRRGNAALLSRLRHERDRGAGPAGRSRS